MEERIIYREINTRRDYTKEIFQRMVEKLENNVIISVTASATDSLTASVKMDLALLAGKMEERLANMEESNTEY